MDQLSPSFQRRSINASRGSSIKLLERMLAIRSKSTEPPTDVRGPLGLNLLHASSEPLIDFVFVHGLNGGSRKTWTYGEDPGLYWPKEWLAKDPAFKNVRIHSFGYNSNWTDTKTTHNIHDFGQSLLNDIQTSPQMREDGGNPIVVVGHSMGGLVVKEAYLLAHRDPECREVATRFHTMVFLATPHRGSELAQSLNYILRSSISHSPQQYITNIERNSEALAMINDAFRHVAKNLDLWSFYETLETSMGLHSTLIVKKDSAVLGYPGEHVGMLQANHREVCKFRQPSDPNYLILRNSFTTIIDKIIKKVSTKTAEKSVTQMRQLETYLGVSEKPEDDLIDLQEARIKGSCEWFTEKCSFQEWLNPSSKPTHLYWISANPATGKSVLSGYIIEHMESLNFECSYYFFRHGDKVKSSISGFLRSIAYQMASTSIDVRQRLVSLMERDVRFDKDDERIIWRKLFGLAIFRADFQRPHYWIVDALDECSNTIAFCQMILKIEETIPVRILVTSRRTPEIVTHFQSLQKQAPSQVVFFKEEISSTDTSSDIKIYLQSNMEKLPVSSVKTRQELLQKVLDKSSGCFLWVKLVLEELEGAWGQHQIETVLEEVPVDMDPLYTRALVVMAEKPIRTKELAKAILTWTMCATRPLTMVELQYALKLDLGDTIDALQKAVASLCGQLVYIDKHSRVQMVHQTARAFLLKDDLDSEFAINSILGHLRLGTITLRYLNSEEMRGQRARKSSRVGLSQSKRSPFVNYASVSFSEHMRQTSSNNNELLGLLDCFLRTNVLSWIEHIAHTGDLHHLTTTAKIIANYLVRYAKYASPLGSTIQRAHLWATDFIRLVANFGKNLLEMPSSIYWLIPPFCPAESAISLQFGSTARGIAVVGLSDTVWDDRLACIEYPDTQATAVACGETYFAVGLLNGEVVLCHNTTCQEWQRLQHNEPLRLLEFDASSSMLASVSRKDIKVWDMASRNVLWHFVTDHDVLSLLFAEDDNVLIAATRGNGTLSWDTTSGLITKELPWTEAFGDERFRRPPLTAAFSSDLSMLAIVYRGRPISIWDMDDQTVTGFLGRESELENLAIGTNTSVASLVFSSNPNLGLLAAAYEDGDLALFDPWNQTTIKVIEANAQEVACSPDGCTLVTGNSAGMVQLFEFDTLELMYRINAFDYGVRSLAFSTDSLRFFDVRGHHCNVWEPSVLVQKLQKKGEDVISEALPAGPRIVGVADIDDVVEITTLICHDSGDYLFCGKSDGSVCLYGTRTGKQISALYSHADDIPITSMCWGGKKNILITADAASQLIAWQLTYNASARVWNASTVLLRQRLSVAVDQLVIDFTNHLLLVLADSSRSIWNLSTGVQTTKWAPMSEVPDFWINHPTDLLKCLSFSTTSITMIDWSTTTALLTRDLMIKLNLNTSPDERIKSVLLCSNGRKVAVEISRKRREDSTSKVLLFESSALQASAEETAASVAQPSISPLPEFFSLSSHVEHLIGTYGTKLVFLNRDSWVCSVDLEKRPVYIKRDSDTRSIDSQSRCPSISQRHSSDGPSGRQQRRGKRPSLADVSFDIGLDVNPFSHYTGSTLVNSESASRSAPSLQNYSPSPLASPSLTQVTSYSRHFFVPTSWHSSLSSSSGHNLTIRVSSRGDVVFIKDEECAIVQHGLEFEEIFPLPEGDTFPL